MKDNMQNTIERLSNEFSALQVGRATKWLVDMIQVDAWYGMLPIWQLANITIPDNMTIRIEPWDKTLVAKIEKWVYDADTWLSPQNNWEYLFVRVPVLTAESRKDIAKQVSKMWEEWKKRIRQARQDERDHVKKNFEDKEISEDEKKNAEIEIDETTKKFNDKIDELVKNKENDVLTV